MSDAEELKGLVEGLSPDLARQAALQGLAAKPLTPGDPPPMHVTIEPATPNVLGSAAEPKAQTWRDLPPLL